MIDFVNKVFFCSLIILWGMFSLVFAGSTTPNNTNGIHLPISTFAFSYAGSEAMTNDGNITFYRNDACFPRQDGILHIIASDKNLTLAKIYYPNGSKVGGATCPNGALIWVPSRHLKSFERIYRKALFMGIILNKAFYDNFQKRHKLKF